MLTHVVCLLAPVALLCTLNDPPYAVEPGSFTVAGDNSVGYLYASDQFLFASDSYKHKVFVYDLNAECTLVKILGEKGKDKGRFHCPGAMYLHRSVLIVAEESRLQFVDTVPRSPNDWKFRTPFGKSGLAPGEFKESTDLTGIDDILFVVDILNHCIQSFDMRCVDSVIGRTLVLTHRSTFDRPGSFPNVIAIFAPNHHWSLVSLFVGEDGTGYKSTIQRIAWNRRGMVNGNSGTESKVEEFSTRKFSPVERCRVKSLLVHGNHLLALYSDLFIVYDMDNGKQTSTLLVDNSKGHENASESCGLAIVDGMLLVCDNSDSIRVFALPHSNSVC